MKLVSRKSLLRGLFGILLYLSVGSVVALIHLGVIPPMHTVISCNDTTIRKNYIRDTVSTGELLGVCLGVPALVIAILEWLIPPSNESSQSVRQCLWRTWNYVCDLFVGTLFLMFLNEMTKVVVGEPRPNFWQTCMPNITDEQCKQTYVHVTWRDCTNPGNVSRTSLVQTMKSFPSGHAALSTFTSIFAMVYLKQRLWGLGSKLFVPFLQLLWALWILYCCQSRVWDNKHHWWDVLAGGLLGGFSALLSLHYFSNWFIRDDDDILENSVSVTETAYKRQDERATRYSRTSIKRLISNTSETENHVDHRLDGRELRDINGTP